MKAFGCSPLCQESWLVCRKKTEIKAFWKQNVNLLFFSSLAYDDFPDCSVFSVSIWLIHFYYCFYPLWIVKENIVQRFVAFIKNIITVEPGWCSNTRRRNRDTDLVMHHSYRKLVCCDRSYYAHTRLCWGWFALCCMTHMRTSRGYLLCSSSVWTHI